MQNDSKKLDLKRTTHLIRRVLFLLILIIIIIGGTFTFFEMQTSKKAIDKTMLITALMISSSLDIEKVSRLTGTLADLELIDYIYLRSQITRIQKINPEYRYIYLFGKTNNPHPFFLIGTGEEGTSDYSPPGQVYFEDSPSLNKVYSTLQPLIGNPFKDRWGTWVSALVPIVDEKSNQLIAVFGMDMNASEYQYEILRRSFMPLIITMFSIVILALGTEYLRRRQLYSHIHMLQQTEVALRESAEYQRVLFTDSQQAIVVMDDKTEKFIDCNRAAVDLFGYSYREQLIGLTLLDVSTPLQYDGEDSLYKSKQVNEICRNLEEVSFKWRCRKPNGKTWDSEVHLMVFHYREKPMMQFSIIDVTNRKQSEDALRKSEERYRAILSILPDMMFVFNKQGLFIDIYANDKQRLYSDPTLAIGKNIFEVLPPTLAELTLSFIEKVFRTGIMQVFQYQLEIDNKLCHFEARLVKKSDEEVLTIVSDITIKVLAEAENIKLQTQLSQAQKMESIGRLAGGVAHDFNNMLQAILGHSELALNDVESASPVHSSLIEIHKAAERSADLTRQLMAFARKQAVLPRVIDPNDAVKGMLKLLKRLIGEDIDLVWLPGDDLWKIRIDPSQIDQILANLCVNARYAISSVGKVTIETGNVTIAHSDVFEHPLLEPGCYVMLAVSDNGSGMSKETLDHLFEPFFTTKSIGEGTGLGLATVYGIVKQNNGFINVYSELNKGTTFKIYLPKYNGVDEPVLSDKVHISVKGGNETIFIVEDEYTILHLTTTMLQQLGYNVLAFSDPIQAIYAAQDYKKILHLLITDVIMPNMNGIDLANKLNECIPNLKCLFMSGYTSHIAVNQGGLQEGVNFIQKPFTLHDLGTKVREILDDSFDSC